MSKARKSGSDRLLWRGALLDFQNSSSTQEFSTHINDLPADEVCTDDGEVYDFEANVFQKIREATPPNGCCVFEFPNYAEKVQVPQAIGVLYKLADKAELSEEELATLYVEVRESKSSKWEGRLHSYYRLPKSLVWQSSLRPKLMISL